MDTLLSMGYKVVYDQDGIMRLHNTTDETMTIVLVINKKDKTFNTYRVKNNNGYVLGHFVDSELAEAIFKAVESVTA